MGGVVEVAAPKALPKGAALTTSGRSQTKKNRPLQAVFKSPERDSNS
jgi:hypothetical protein